MAIKQSRPSSAMALPENSGRLASSPASYQWDHTQDHSRLYGNAVRYATAAALLVLGISLVVLPHNSIGTPLRVLFCLAMMALPFGTRLSALVLRVRPRPEPASQAGAEPPVLVIGGAGYIGSILVRKLLQAGRRVRVLDSLVYGDGALREVLDHPNLELIVGDCRNLKTVIRAVKGSEAIIHLAAIVGDPACAQHSETALETNYAATRMLIEVAKGNGIQRFLFASSCSVYGASDELMYETSAASPISLYAQTKVDSEQALLRACDETFRPTILRLSTVFGLSPRPRFDLVVNLLTAKACQGHPITVFNGEQWRPFIHVSDVADGFIRVLDAPLGAVGGEIFNLGDARLNYTLTGVAEKIMIFFPDAKIEHAAVTDRRNYRVSFDKLRDRLDFQCSLDLDYGIEQIRRAFAEGEILDYNNYQYSNQKFLQLAGSPSNQDEVDQSVMAAFAHTAPVGKTLVAA